MKHLYLLAALCAAGLACGTKHYQQSQYPFHNPAFTMDTLHGLKTNGVYVLRSIQSGDSIRQATVHQFYRFYATGQSNLTLDNQHSITTPAGYVNAVRKDAAYTGHGTLFEGYYRQQGGRMVIQEVTMPLRQFNYRYGYTNQDSLVLVRSTIKGKGRFTEDYFHSNYKEVYLFMPLPALATDSYRPHW
ncbi:hypothetical protein HNQ91_005387 [Filimonas zeae]|uniref:Lipoprotein n=1 Tax=Filimonas zeae TaxID=1737353 RepID=A0A917J3N3_9BACT|nr:hypothetical protein [Filimonas zeae]MDR6342303.1 hypothetical protein [Filimonas zeae]GGH80792.1 hypothetical protein GCM10011379_52190 [Filimonas zeae]